MIEIKRKLFHNKRKIIIPVWVVAGICAIIIPVSYNIKPDNPSARQLAYISALTVMPEGLIHEAEKTGRNILAVLQSNNQSSDIRQKDSNFNDSDTENILHETPADILKSINRTVGLFDSGKYIYDGEILEKTFTDYQATDSFENIHIKNTTESKEVDIESVLEHSFSLPVDDLSKPVVLIYHTHTTETYVMADNGKFSSSYSERSDDKSVNMIRVGEEIARVLEANGIGVIHDKTVYDEVYTGAYKKSRASIEKILEKNPSIIITLDIHRDAIHYDSTTRIKQTTQIQTAKAAQMMIITGAEDGNITDFPDWETNLEFAVRLQKAVNDKYSNLMKPILFCCRKYNMDITPYSLLIEVGTDMNTLKEAAYSGRLLADVLSAFIKEYTEAKK